MIIDEKFIMLPNMPYLSGASSAQSSPYASSIALPSLRRRRGLTLTSLPAHILLQIIHDTFPHSQPEVPTYSPTYASTSYQYNPYSYRAGFTNYEDYETLAERQRRTLYWLSTSLRLVSRQLYTACMHVLRSTYLPTYATLVRPGYTSDPFPMGVPTAPAPISTSSSSSASGPNGPTPRVPDMTAPPAYRAPSPAPCARVVESTKMRSSASSVASTSRALVSEAHPIISPHRETPVLDRFILLKVRADIFADESSLHQDCDDGFRDIFDVAQPRARLEDLVRMYGAQSGVVYVPGWSRAAVTGSVGPLNDESQVSPGSSVGSLPLRYSESATAGNAQKPESTISTFNVPTAEKTEVGTPSSTAAVANKKRSKLFSFGKKAAASLTSPLSSSSSSRLTAPLQSPSTAAAPPHSYISSSQSQLDPQIRTRPVRVTPIAFPLLSVSFSPRKVGLVLKRSRTIVEVPRHPGRKETLESLAQALVRELRVVLEQDED